MAGNVRYQPLDEFLQRPGIRVLRALRWFDWVEPADLIVASGIDEDSRDNFDKALTRGVRDGHIERRREMTTRGAGYVYRITAAGRARLAERIEAATDRRVAA